MYGVSWVSDVLDVASHKERAAPFVHYIYDLVSVIEKYQKKGAGICISSITYKIYE